MKDKLTDNQQFTSHFDRNVQSLIDRENLFTKKDKLLLAISGGVDSTSLLHFLNINGYQFAIAHCNFDLRGASADEDTRFCKMLALLKNKTFHYQKFETQKYADENGISIQMAARDLRYTYFNKLAEDDGYTKIVVGTNLNDQVETVILNLTKETGLAGLTGIRLKNKLVVRPFAESLRADIEKYASINELEFRTDESNADNKYQRNLIRNKVLPLLKEINPSVEQSVLNSIYNLKESSKIIDEYLQGFIKQHVVFDGDNVEIEAEALLNSKSIKTVLFGVLENHHFSPRQIDELVHLVAKSQTGKQMSNEKYTAFKDRNKLVVKPIDEDHNDELVIDQIPFGNAQLSIKPVVNPKFSSSQNIEVVDGLALKLPLTLRTWQPGDKMKPLGMTNSKLISDVLTDEKYPSSKKNNAQVLVNADGKIIWLVGVRVSESFKYIDGNGVEIAVI